MANLSDNGRHIALPPQHKNPDVVNRAYPVYAANIWQIRWVSITEIYQIFSPAAIANLVKSDNFVTTVLVSLPIRTACRSFNSKNGLR